MGDNNHPHNGQAISSSEAQLLDRIRQLEAELQETKALMAGLTLAGSGERTLGEVRQRGSGEESRGGLLLDPSDTTTPPFDPNLHHLLLLSDSALPLGSFAFSSGLESYLTHHQSSHTISPPPSPSILLRRFLALSLTSLATTTLPFLTATYRLPHSPASQSTKTAIAEILILSDTFDATTTCPVLRRASTTQGKALLSVWEKSLRPPASSTPGVVDIHALITSYRQSSPADSPPHLPIAWALISLSSGLSLSQTTFVFLLNHTKAILSAAVRLNLIGPYVAQKILAAPETLVMIRRAQEVGVGLGVEEAGQTVPTLDLYGGRHELLYSRVFNS